MIRVSIYPPYLSIMYASYTHVLCMYALYPYLYIYIYNSVRSFVCREDSSILSGWVLPLGGRFGLVWLGNELGEGRGIRDKGGKGRGKHPSGELDCRRGCLFFILIPSRFSLCFFLPLPLAHRPLLLFLHLYLGRPFLLGQLFVLFTPLSR